MASLIRTGFSHIYLRREVEHFHKLVPCCNVGQASTNRELRIRVLAPYGLFFLYCDKYTTFSHLKSRLFNHGLLTLFIDRFINDTLEKSLLTNSRHARSGEMRCRLYQTLGKSDYQLMRPATLTFLPTLDSKHVKTPLPGYLDI